MFGQPRVGWRLPFLVLWLASCNAFATALAPVQSAASDFEPRFESVGAGVIPRDVVPTFVQDRQGFLWIATGDGLVRYDGYRFRPQERQSTQALARSLGWVRALLAGRDGRVWIGTETKGLAAYDPATDRITDYGALASATESSTASPDPLPTIRALAEDEQGRIYVGSTGGGLELFDPQTGQFSRFAPTGAAGALPDDRILALLVDSHQDLWVGSWAGLARKKKESQQFEAFQHADLRGLVVQALFEASDGRIWVGTQEGALRVLDPQTGRITKPVTGQTGIHQGPISSFVETPDKALWVGRSGGIQIFDTRSSTLLRQLQHEVRRPSGLAGNDVTHMLLDRAGWVWVGGFGLGLQRHNPGNKSIALREADLSGTSPLANADVRSLLHLSNGEVWAATQAGGVAILNGALQAIGKLPGSDQPIESMVQMRDGSIWLGSGGRLHQYDAQHRALRSIPHRSGQTRRLFESQDGTLWVGTQDGVFKVEKTSQNLQRVTDAQGHPKGEVHAFAQAPDHSLWIGSSDGLYRLPPGNQKEKVQRVLSVGEADIIKGVVIGLLFDAEGRLWLDTGTGGLHRMTHWDATGAAFDRVSERHGRVGKPFGANLLEDKQGRIWSQMNVYDPLQDKFVELTHADGANLGTGWFFSYAKTSDGRFLFGGSKGILVVKPELFEESSYTPPLWASELRINGERKALGNLAAGIHLAASDRSFSVEFTALDYADPARLEYAYKLENFDPDWIKTSSSARIASYSNLAPGKYTLRIRATNRSGVWSPVEQAIGVQVQPAWWQKPWMAALALLLLALSVYALVAWRTRRLRRLQKELEDRVQERTAELETMALELQINQLALEESSVSDPLTGLNNRRFLTQCIDADLALTIRTHENHLSHGAAFNETQDLLFFMFDIDHFKQVNDSYGHMAGDEVLKEFSSRLKAVFRDTDYLIRWGGEEFLGLARQTTRKNAAELAERARASITREPFVLQDGTRIALACSVGFTCFPLSPTQPRLLGWFEMVKIADAALYTVKHLGRDGWLGVIECQPAPLDDIQNWIKRPLQEWIASGQVATSASERMQVELRADA